ncbi:MAG: tetratricopeptide repeat protein [Verrucomicrobiales bacterium]|nr:tetratricopeptide repeat protein [Verrucomicrobiales bacterium]
MAASAAGQVTVRGQVLMPGGSPPSEPMRFYLQSDDGRVNDYRFTDSNGRFILERLDPAGAFSIRIDGDGTRYETTMLTFRPQFQQVIRVILNPIERPLGEPVNPGTVSAATAYKPKPEAEKLHAQARAEIDKENLDAAEPLLRRAVAADPLFFEAQHDLAAVLIAGARYAEAEAVLRDALKADAKSAVALTNLGAVLNRQKKFADAVAPLREAVRLEPGLVLAHVQLGIALVETEQYADAERELKVGTRKPGEEELMGLLYLGKLYALTGKYTEGIASLESYLQKNPSAPNAEEVRKLIGRMKTEMAKK